MLNINYKNRPILCKAIFYPIFFPFRCSYWWRDILSLGFSLDLPEPDVEALLHSAISPSSQPFSSRLFTLMTTNLLHVTIIIIMFFIFQNISVYKMASGDEESTTRIFYQKLSEIGYWYYPEILPVWACS